MTSALSRLALALVLFAGAMIAVSEARRAERVADLHERLVTLDHAAEDPSGEGDAWWRVGPLATLGRDARHDHATMAYWRSDFPALTDPDGLVAGTGEQVGEQADLIFLAANATFRGVPTRGVDRALTIERLDRVIDQYADVLRVDPSHRDASFNFEYVTRVRDQIARGRPGRTDQAPGPAPVIPSPDLPTGPTVHGRPGGPPPEIPGNEFRTLAPMPYDEREESDPGQGPAPRRRG